MKITVTSVLVDDQTKALKFYTEILVFLKKTNVWKKLVALGKDWPTE